MRRCCMCGVEKPLSEFAFRSLATSERQSHCRACHAAYRRQHYLRNRDVYIAREAARIKAFRIENRVKMFDYLSIHPCVDCGETDVLVLEFDHRDPATKKRDIGFMAARKPWKFVLAEIEKCDVRCVNCHRRRTARQFNWAKSGVPERSTLPDPVFVTVAELLAAQQLVGVMAQCSRCRQLKPADQFGVKNPKTGRRSTICRECVRAYGRAHYRKHRSVYIARGRKNKRRYRKRNRNKVLEYLDGKACVDCGATDPVVLEFDHRDGVEKEDEVAHLMASGQWSKVEAEIAKCDVRCANCHRRRTAEQFGWTRRTLQIAAASPAQDGPPAHEVHEELTTYWLRTTIAAYAGVAQLVERLVPNQEVFAGSRPVSRSAATGS